MANTSHQAAGTVAGPTGPKPGIKTTEFWIALEVPVVAYLKTDSADSLVPPLTPEARPVSPARDAGRVSTSTGSSNAIAVETWEGAE